MTEVLKLDACGRVQLSAERREALLGEFERSGVSGVKFARLRLSEADVHPEAIKRVRIPRAG